jgi:hypothetical protein
LTTNRSALDANRQRRRLIGGNRDRGFQHLLERANPDGVLAGRQLAIELARLSRRNHAAPGIEHVIRQGR